jgi:hypothetical protein
MPCDNERLEHEGTGKAKAIGSNPLAGFQVQIGCGAVLAMGLGNWGPPLERRGLMTG